MSRFPRRAREDFLARGVEPYNAPAPPSSAPNAQDLLVSSPQIPTVPGSIPSPAPPPPSSTATRAHQQEPTPAVAEHQAVLTLHTETSIVIPLPPESDEAPTCPICLDDLTDDPPAIRIRVCSHAYHEPCLRLWMEESNTCPTCRATLYGPSPQVVTWHEVPAAGLSPLERGQTEQLWRPQRLDLVAPAHRAPRGPDASPRFPGPVNGSWLDAELDDVWPGPPRYPRRNRGCMRERQRQERGRGRAAWLDGYRVPPRGPRGPSWAEIDEPGWSTGLVPPQPGYLDEDVNDYCIGHLPDGRPVYQDRFGVLTERQPGNTRDGRRGSQDGARRDRGYGHRGRR